VFSKDICDGEVFKALKQKIRQVDVFKALNHVHFCVFISRLNIQSKTRNNFKQLGWASFIFILTLQKSAKILCFKKDLNSHLWVFRGSILFVYSPQYFLQSTRTCKLSSTFAHTCGRLHSWILLSLLLCWSMHDYFTNNKKINGSNAKVVTYESKARQRFSEMLYIEGHWSPQWG
jgi:hypothetical protein